MPSPELLSKECLCIVGGSQGRDDAHKYVDTNWNIWCVARIYDAVPYATMVFDMHQDATHRNRNTFNAHRDGKLVLQYPVEYFPDALILPTPEIIDEFGAAFTSSFSWMIAYGLYLGMKQIALCGVNMSHESELDAQRPGLFYILGFARARGVEIILPEFSQLRTEVKFATN